MTLESLERTYRPPWLAQFGLYKYESAVEPLDDTYVSIPSKKFRFGFLLLCGILLVLFLVTYFIITDLSRVERVGVVGHVPIESEIESDVTDAFPALVVEMLNNTDDKNDQSESVEVTTTSEALNHRSIHAVQPQKLVFLPSRVLRPPKMDVPVRAKRRRDRPPRRRNQAPKPFNHYMPEPHPAPFKRVPTRGPTRRFYDPSGFKPYIPGMQDGFRPVVGSFRRPKGTVPTNYYQSLASNHHSSFLPTPEVDTTFYGYPSSTVSYIPDPFHKYKPAVPADVNLLVLDQPSREQHLKMYNEQYLKNAQTLYQQVVKASRQKMNEINSRGTQKQRPFQLMLDVYPMPQETEDPTRRPTSKYNRFSPYAAKYNALNSINHDKSYDSSYFNRIRFAQIQKNPHPYENPYVLKINQEGKYVNDLLEASGSETQTTVAGGENPSQLVVHLNLFPKKKKKGKRVRRPIDYNNGSEEDSSEYLRRSSMESDEMFEEETEVLEMTDKKDSGRPLRSTKPSYKKKTTKNIDKEDSSPIAINFNFSTDATKKNCSHIPIQQKYVPMMDGNDNDVAPSMNTVPKAHDFPYRFASMPPAHIKSYIQHPMRQGSHRFQHRILKLEGYDKETETTTETYSTEGNPSETSTIEVLEKEG